MARSTIERLTEAYQGNPEATFSLFTLAGHVVSGRITAIDDTITLTAGKEIAEVPVDRVEAFCYRKL
jgi:hypothetical protein